MPDWITQYWVQWLFGLGCTLLTIAYNRMTTKVRKDIGMQNAIHNGVKALLADRIMQLYGQYISQGYCDIEARQQLKELYEAYHGLDGNSIITNLLERIIALPTELPPKD